MVAARGELGLRYTGILRSPNSPYVDGLLHSTRAPEKPLISQRERELLSSETAIKTVGDVRRIAKAVLAQPIVSFVARQQYTAFAPERGRADSGIGIVLDAGRELGIAMDALGFDTNGDFQVEVQRASNLNGDLRKIRNGVLPMVTTNGVVHPGVNELLSLLEQKTGLKPK